MPDGGMLPIFPLSNVALFPALQIPLHIFEPRYRQMTADSLAGERRIGMVAVRPDQLADMANDPAIFPIGCAGLITRVQQLRDGRYHLLLRGTHRFRVEEEPPRPAERLYRCARVVALEDAFDPADAGRVAALRVRVRELLDALATTAGAAAPDLRTLAVTDDLRFVNALSNGLGFATVEKQALLEADSILARYEQLAGLIDFRLAERQAVGSPNSSTIH